MRTLPPKTCSSCDRRAGPNVGSQYCGSPPKTVSVYRARVMAKLKLSTNAELTRYALERGLLE